MPLRQSKDFKNLPIEGPHGLDKVQVYNVSFLSKQMKK